MRKPDACRHVLLLACCLCTAQTWLAASARAASIGECTGTQLSASTFRPDDDAITAHRQFEVPDISYPYGTQLKGIWGFGVTVRVDEAGRVVCYSAKGMFDVPVALVLNAQRRALINRLSEWHYSPFASDGRIAAAIVTERIREQELPERHLPLPAVPLAKVHIALNRSGCFGSCPSYRIDIYGDGRVDYEGDGFVDVEGNHSYRVPSEQVAQLVADARAKDLWSLRPSYRAEVTDLATVTLMLDMGGQTHSIEDYVGQWAGMPSSVTDFESEVAKVARSDMWVHLSQDGVEHLKAEGFAFDSQAGAELLVRAVEDDESRDDQALVNLLDLGAPIEGAAARDGSRPQSHVSLLEEALKHQREGLIAPLIAKGALNTAGKPDQRKIDAAFDAAIAGGRLAPVQALWAIRGDRPHPSLTFDDVSDDGDKSTHKTTSVTLLLSHRFGRGSWDGLDIAKWLLARGCDINASGADGRTLLHIAAEANDAPFVRYLLSVGMKASTPGKFGLPAMGSTLNEDVVMILLDAGTDPSRLDGDGFSFRQLAEENHWMRVLAWLSAHGK